MFSGKRQDKHSNLDKCFVKPIVFKCYSTSWFYFLTLYQFPSEQISSNLGDWQYLYIDLVIITSLALVSKFQCFCGDSTLQNMIEL